MRRVRDNIYIRDAQLSDAYELAPRLREADRKEVYRSGGFSSEDALHASIAASRVARVAVIDGLPEIVWGVADRTENARFGVVWLLSSERLYDIKRDFLVESAKEVREFMRTYDHIGNYVDIFNTKTQDWLTTMGFQSAGAPLGRGPINHPFLYFYKENWPCASL